VNLLEAIKYIILGLIQGITEVLPISSSGHVEIAKALISLNADEGLLFLIIVNSGSLITFLAIYYKKVIQMVKDFFLFVFKKNSREVTRNGFLSAIKLLIACIPAAIVGFLFKDLINQWLIQYNVLLSGVGLLFTGTILLLVSTKKIRKGFTQITFVDAFFIGIAQSVALLPGISRSGMTTSTGIKRGVGIDSALDFSFMMYIPISIGSTLIYLKDILQEGIIITGTEYYFYYFLAFLTAVISTYIAFKLVFNIFKSGKLKYFGIYCLLIGMISIIIFIAR